MRKADVRPGTFIAAVGADAEHKQAIDPVLIASAKVVADSLKQSCAIGDVHHAIAQNLMQKKDVYAELCEIVAGQKKFMKEPFAEGIGNDFDFAASDYPGGSIETVWR